MRTLHVAWSLGRGALLVVLPLAVVGCVAGGMPAPSSTVRALTPAPAVYCHDGTGHTAGATPWILGGKCCCTPTRAMFDVHQAEKTVPADMTYEAYLKLYADKGIKTGLDHAGCNNRCADGPHVVFGGKCMATPTPGTENYEQVTRGQR
jgi:hypothetical protein